MYRELQQEQRQEAGGSEQGHQRRQEDEGIEKSLVGGGLGDICCLRKPQPVCGGLFQGQQPIFFPR